MSQSCVIFISTETDPYFHLALEDFLLREREFLPPYFFLLYINRPSVVLGRFQNPWKECHMPLMAESNVDLVRRASGGGTVFHDLGNLNFNFFCPPGHQDKLRHAQLVAEVIAQLGGKAEVNHRFDVLCAGKKISGSAYKVGQYRAYHHGTLLVQADLTGLRKFLRPPVREIHSNATASVRSEVTTLQQFLPGETLTMNKVQDLFVECYGKYSRYKHRQIFGVDRSFPDLWQKKEEYGREKWILGHTPPFEHILSKNFSWGKMEGSIKVKGAQIEEILLQRSGAGGFENLTKWLESLEKSLIGVAYEGEKISLALASNISLFPGGGKFEVVAREEICAWLEAEIGQKEII